MSNRELLELAAKAGDIKGEYVSWCYNGFKEGIREPNDKSSIPWNPLTDDGPALRLAVKLRLNIDMTDCQCCIHIYANQLNGDGPDVSIRHLKSFNDCEIDDPYAATRQAIVRAAAQIGKASI